MDPKLREIYLYWLLRRRTYSPRLTTPRLPDAIGRLTNLHTLDLGYCHRLTCLPDSLGRLTRLRKLLLYGCFELICLPDSLGHLTELHELLLNGCGWLTSLPESVGRLTALQQLRCAGCRLLKQVPESLGNLVELRELDLRQCPLTRLPDSVGRLTRLQELYVGSRGLSQLPESLAECRALEILCFGQCNFAKLPENMGQLSELRILDLRDCQLTCLPDSLSQLKKLEKIDLEYCNSLTILPDSFDLTLLRRDDRYNSRLLLSIRLEKLQRMPEFDRLALVCNLTHLTVTAMITSLPESFGLLSSLTKLQLANCPALCCLPNSIGMLTRLTAFEMYKCHPICLPESFASLRLSSVVIELTWLSTGLPRLAAGPMCRYVVDGYVLVPGHVSAVIKNADWRRLGTWFSYRPTPTAEDALNRTLLNFYLPLLTLIVATRRRKSHPQLPNEIYELIYTTARDSNYYN